ncbi:MAG: glycosyltransferase [Clostridia bacterium]|nr:glycosyltransferase [Clostridia bacterium]
MRNILCLSTSNYYPFPTRKQNIMNRLAGCNILYVDPPVSLIAPLKDPKAKERLTAYKDGPKQAQPGLKVYAQPPVVPFFNRKRAINERNQKRLAKYLAQIVRENGFGDDFWVWCYSPTSCDVIAPLAAQLGLDSSVLWKRTIYDCVDRHSAYPGQIDPAVVDAMEEDLARSCGCVFATAQGLYERLKAFNENTHLIPNGCAFELFNRAAGLEKTGAFAGPHFGFVGMLQECLDYGCLKAVASAFPDGKVTLIGRSLPGVDLSWTEQFPNVELTGLVPQPQLPERIRDFDVCLNVFADNDLSRDVSPLKFYEYLATGKPVVSTLVPLQVLDYADCIYLAETPDEFAARCREALAEGSDDPRRRARIEAARCNSWDEKVKEMKAILGWD